ncbi:hypothetical protein BJ170DRAFT_591166 [Xylariales sp. AK1849]|nr:hypothetical protein BJ170DRAFT_591166 [Xylariales sp. AK1849]
MAPNTNPTSRSISPISNPDSDNMTKSSKRKGNHIDYQLALGTRSVSTLTPSQLARKRANDREAQRAIRARTKEHIENLERELEELRSTQSRDETVQDLMRRNRALEEELHRLKDSMGIPSSSSRNFYPPAYHSSNPRPPAQSNSEYSMELGSYDNLSNSGDGWPSAIPRAIPSTVSSPSSSGATDDLGSAYFPTSAPSMLDRSGLSSSMNSPTVSCISGKMGYDDIKPEARHRVPTDQHSPNPTSLSTAAPMEPVPRVLPGVLNAINESTTTTYWETPPSVAKPLSQTDALLVSYVQDCQRLVNLAVGRPHPEVIFGPSCPNIRRLVETHWDLAAIVPQSTLQLQPAPPHPLVELATTLSDDHHLVMMLERLGNYVLLQRLLAWLIQPTQETYTLLGDELVPRQTQRTIPHPQWIDFLYWGQLRDAVIQRQDVYATTEFRHLYSSSLRLLNWPGGHPQAFIPDHSTGAMYLTHPFINHALDIGNWALDEGFFRRYPELGGLVPAARHGP